MILNLNIKLMNKFFIVLLIIPILLSFGCMREPEKIVKQKLEVIVKDDLEYMKSEIPVSELSDSAYYIITGFDYFPKDTKFSYKETLVNPPKHPGIVPISEET